MIIYIKTGCQYCEKVQRVVTALKVDVEYRNLHNDVYAKELIEQGGKRQVPYMIDSKRNVGMYESADIISHLMEYYPADAEGEESAKMIQKEVTPNVCIPDFMLDLKHPSQ